jgi:diamine N-acetyltransferase
MINLENNIIKLRAVEPVDLELLYEWENSADLWNVSDTTVPYSRHILAQYIETARQDIFTSKQLRLMIDLKQPAGAQMTIGIVDLFDFDPLHLRAGVGIAIFDGNCQRHGYALQALRLLKLYAFDFLSLHQLYCNIIASNKASLRLFLKAGFRKTGVKYEWRKTAAQWEDEYILQCFASTPKAT